MSRLRRFFRPPGTDPGAEWVEQLLSPLRDERIACDVAPRLMGRIAAELPARRPIGLRAGTSRLALGGSLFVGFAAFVFLLSALVMRVTGEDEGARLLSTMLEPAAPLAESGARHLYRFALSVGAAGLAILRGAWVVAVAASPLIRGAGLLAAAGGLLSILFSTFLFAHARRVAPMTGPRGGEPLCGGFR